MMEKDENVDNSNQIKELENEQNNPLSLFSPNQKYSSYISSSKNSQQLQMQTSFDNLTPSTNSLALNEKEQIQQQQQNENEPKEIQIEPKQIKNKQQSDNLRSSSQTPKPSPQNIRFQLQVQQSPSSSSSSSQHSTTSTQSIHNPQTYMQRIQQIQSQLPSLTSNSAFPLLSTYEPNTHILSLQQFDTRQMVSANVCNVIMRENVKNMINSKIESNQTIDNKENLKETDKYKHQRSVGRNIVYIQQDLSQNEQQIEKEKFQQIEEYQSTIQENIDKTNEISNQNDNLVFNDQIKQQEKEKERENQTENEQILSPPSSKRIHLRIKQQFQLKPSDKDDVKSPLREKEIKPRQEKVLYQDDIKSPLKEKEIKIIQKKDQIQDDNNNQNQQIQIVKKENEKVIDAGIAQRQFTTPKTKKSKKNQLLQQPTTESSQLQQQVQQQSSQIQQQQNITYPIFTSIVTSPYLKSTFFTELVLPSQLQTSNYSEQLQQQQSQSSQISNSQPLQQSYTPSILSPSQSTLSLQQSTLSQQSNSSPSSQSQSQFTSPTQVLFHNLYQSQSPQVQLHQQELLQLQHYQLQPSILSQAASTLSPSASISNLTNNISPSVTPSPSPDNIHVSAQFTSNVLISPLIIDTSNPPMQLQHQLEYQYQEIFKQQQQLGNSLSLQQLQIQLFQQQQNTQKSFNSLQKNNNQTDNVINKSILIKFKEKEKEIQKIKQQQLQYHITLFTIVPQIISMVNRLPKGYFVSNKQIMMSNINNINFNITQNNKDNIRKKINDELSVNQNYNHSQFNFTLFHMGGVIGGGNVSVAQIQQYSQSSSQQPNQNNKDSNSVKIPRKYKKQLNQGDKLSRQRQNLHSSSQINSQQTNSCSVVLLLHKFSSNQQQQQEQTVSQRKGRRSYRKRDTRLSDSEQSQRRIKTDRRMKDTSDDDVDDDQDELLDMDDDEDDDELMQEEEQIADEEQDNDIGKIDSVIDVNNNIVETSPHDESNNSNNIINNKNQVFKPSPKTPSNSSSNSTPYLSSLMNITNNNTNKNNNNNANNININKQFFSPTFQKLQSQYNSPTLSNISNKMLIVGFGKDYAKFSTKINKNQIQSQINPNLAGDKLGAIHKDEYLRNLSSLSTITSSFAAHFMFSSSQYSQQNQVPFSKYKRHINYFIIPPQLAQQTLISWVSGGNYDNQGAVVHRLRNKKSGIIITQATVKQKNPNFNQNSNQISNSNLATNGKDKQNNQQRKYSIGGSGLVSGERDILNQRERGSGTAQSAQSQNSQQQQQQSNKKVVNGDLWCECGGWAGKQRVSWSQTGFFDGIGANDDLLVLEIGVGKKDENVDQQYIQQQKMKVGMEKDSDADQLNNIEQIKNVENDHGMNQNQEINNNNNNNNNAFQFQKNRLSMFDIYEQNYINTLVQSSNQQSTPNLATQSLQQLLNSNMNILNMKFSTGEPIIVNKLGLQLNGLFTTIWNCVSRIRQRQVQYGQIITQQQILQLSQSQQLQIQSNLQLPSPSSLSNIQDDADSDNIPSEVEEEMNERNGQNNLQEEMKMRFDRMISLIEGRKLKNQRRIERKTQKMMKKRKRIRRKDVGKTEMIKDIKTKQINNQLNENIDMNQKVIVNVENDQVEQINKIKKIIELLKERINQIKELNNKLNNKQINKNQTKHSEYSSSRCYYSVSHFTTYSSLISDNFSQEENNQLTYNNSSYIPLLIFNSNGVECVIAYPQMYKQYLLTYLFDQYIKKEYNYIEKQYEHQHQKRNKLHRPKSHHASINSVNHQNLINNDNENDDNQNSPDFPFSLTPHSSNPTTPSNPSSRSSLSSSLSPFHSVSVTRSVSISPIISHSQDFQHQLVRSPSILLSNPHSNNQSPYKQHAVFHQQQPYATTTPPPPPPQDFINQSTQSQFLASNQQQLPQLNQQQQQQQQQQVKLDSQSTFDLQLDANNNEQLKENVESLIELNDDEDLYSQSPAKKKKKKQSKKKKKKKMDQISNYQQGEQQSIININLSTNSFHIKSIENIAENSVQQLDQQAEILQDIDKQNVMLNINQNIQQLVSVPIQQPISGSSSPKNIVPSQNQHSATSYQILTRAASHIKEQKNQQQQTKPFSKSNKLHSSSPSHFSQQNYVDTNNQIHIYSQSSVLYNNLKNKSNSLENYIQINPNLPSSFTFSFSQLQQQQQLKQYHFNHSTYSSSSHYKPCFCAADVFNRPILHIQNMSNCIDQNNVEIKEQENAINQYSIMRYGDIAELKHEQQRIDNALIIGNQSNNKDYKTDDNFTNVKINHPLFIIRPRKKKEQISINKKQSVLNTNIPQTQSTSNSNLSPHFLTLSQTDSSPHITNQLQSQLQSQKQSSLSSLSHKQSSHIHLPPHTRRQSQIQSSLQFRLDIVTQMILFETGSEEMIISWNQKD